MTALVRCVSFGLGRRWIALWLLLPLLLTGNLRAENVSWSSTAGGATNLTSAGQPMSQSFRFEVGVFANGFIPTSNNTDSWTANWVPADRTTYNSTTHLFSSAFVIENNYAPFTVGAKAYIWGFSGSSAAGEWILFRNTDWKWVAPNPFDPLGLTWEVASVNEVILGTVNPAGSPFLMRSAAVNTVTAPSVSWAEWQAEFLVGNPLNGPTDDPDGDLIPNLLEFVYGTSPVNANAPATNAVSIVESGGKNYLEMSVPRLKDRSATLVVEVSGDLQTWFSGTSASEVILSDPAVWIVRDRTPIDPANPRRFMRVRASLP